MHHHMYLALALVVVSGVRAYHILCYHPIPTRSHDLLAQGVINPLIKAGHKITWVTPFPDGKPEKVTIIDVSQTIKIIQGLDMANRKVTGFEIAKSFADNVTRAAFTEELQQALIQNQYDAVISEWFFSDVEAGFAAVQKVPWIVLSGFPMYHQLARLVDRPSPLAVPPLGHDYPLPLNFWDRLKTTFAHLAMVYDDWINHMNEAVVYEQFFSPVAAARGVTLPPYGAAVRDAAVLLVSSHPTFSPAHSLPPNVVDIGGYHIEENTPPLPKDLQDLLDSSHEGVVYFSLGSVIRAANLPVHTLRGLVEVLGSVPHTVLWKFEGTLDDLPKNVHIRPWWPQSSILAHPKTRLFITHCGLLSSLEALHHGLPLLALPVFADQPALAALAVSAGRGLRVAFRDDMREEFQKALRELLKNDSYYKKAKYMSKLFRKRPVAPSALIRHYVELAIETNGAHHLRPAARLYAWHQAWLLDQLAAALLASLLVYVALRKILSMLRKRYLGASKASENKKRN